MDFLDLWLDGVQPDHQHCILLSGDLGSFFPGTRPGERSGFQSFIKKEEPGSFPEEPFDTIGALSAKQEQYVLLEWVQIELRPDVCQAIDTLSKVCIATGDADPLYPCSFSQHVLQPQ